MLGKLAQKALAKRQLQGTFHWKGVEGAEDRRDSFASLYKGGAHHRAAETLERDWERMLTFYRFTEEHWKRLRTADPVESPSAVLRLRTDAAKGYKKVTSVMALICKMLLVAERSFRKLAAPEKIMVVFPSIGSTDRLEVKGEEALAVA